MSLKPPQNRKRLAEEPDHEGLVKQKRPKLRPVTARYVQEKLVSRNYLARSLKLIRDLESQRYRLSELQKVAERSKAAEIRKAQKDPRSAERLSMLQEVDHERIACSVLHKKITKVEGLAQEGRMAEALAVVLPEGCRRKLSKPVTKDEVDVEARVTNNKHFQDELRTTLEHLTGLAAQPLPEVKSRLQTSSSSPEPGEWTGVFGGSDLSDVDMSDGSEMSDRIYDVTDEEEGSVDDDGWESGSVDESGRVVSSAARKPSRDREENDDDDSSDVAIDLDLEASDISDSASESYASEDEAGPSNSNRGKNKAKAGESIFLPSLSVGFMPGEHDPYDDFENADIDGPPGGGAIGRKNRRGQKARRAIWEKKFGSKAKHRQKEREQWEQETRRKADLKAARLAERQARQKPGTSSHQDHTLAEATPPSEHPQRNRPQADEAPKATASKRIHPAWEAKLKMMQKQTVLMTTQPQGKKIVFT